MKTFTKVSDFKLWRKELSSPFGFVPTMGALHKGHQSLFERSVAENDQTAISLFVNPTQFDDPKDFEAYQTHLERDLQMAKEVGVNAVFHPKYEDVYPNGYVYAVSEKEISQKLEGRHRRGHFDGMLTIVLKLLNIAQPNRAYFGEKDYQQLYLVEKMVEDFFLDCQIVGCPTVREDNRLALSSRNARLNEAEKAKATLLVQLLESDKTNEEIRDELTQAGFSVDYIENWNGRRLGAAHLGNVRLIDNVKKSPS